MHSSKGRALPFEKPAFHEVLFLAASVAPFLSVGDLVPLAWSTTEVRAAIAPFANMAAFYEEIRIEAERWEICAEVVDSSDCDDWDTQSSDISWFIEAEASDEQPEVSSD